MNAVASAVLSGIEACHRCLSQHPAEPVRAVNSRFDYAETTTGPQPRPAGPLDRWIELRPHACGIAVQLAEGPLRLTTASVPYPGVIGHAGDEPHPDLDAIVSDRFLEVLCAAVDRALEQLTRLPEPAHA